MSDTPKDVSISASTEVVTPELPKKKISPKEARDILWRKANLTWKLDKNQNEMYDMFKSNPDKITVISASRRLGKSYFLCTVASMACLEKEGTIVKYITPEQKMAKMIIKPIMEQLFKDCPKDLRPEFKTNDNLYRFPNGSEIQIAGTDNGRHESLRGGNCHLGIIDEAGFCDELDYVVKSVLLPTTTTTKGKILLASTPPKTLDHEFKKYLDDAEFKNKLIKKTIYDNPRLTPEMIYEILNEYEGGELNVEFRREYLAEIIADEHSVIVPEFTPAIQKEIVMEWPRPPMYDAYTAMDIGFTDLTFVLFAYYDFKNAKVVIEDEFVINGPKMTTDKLAEKIKKKEETLWFHHITKEKIKPHLRVSDNNLIVINDLQVKHGLTFLPTAKDDALAALNQLRMRVGSKGVIINPRCINLIKHLKGGSWNKAKTSYARSPDNGHYDGIDALKYLLRNINYTRNPYPAHYGIGSIDNTFINPEYIDNSRSESAAVFKKVFKINK